MPATDSQLGIGHSENGPHDPTDLSLRDADEEAPSPYLEEEGEDDDDADAAAVKPKEKKTRKKGRSRKKTKFGDEKMVFDDFDSVDDFEKASFREVWQTCCIHSAGDWGKIALAIVLLFACAYFFIVGIELVNSSAQVMAGCKAGQIFGEITNPLTALMIGILATAMIHSSGATTAIIVALVDASVLTTSQGIYMVMGANIGTTITCSMVSLGHIRRSQELDRAFSAASTHSMFNFMTCAVLFPLECATGFLNYLTTELTVGAETGGREPWLGPVRHLTSALTKLIIIPGKSLVVKVAAGASTCDDFYPLSCEGGVESYDTCTFGLIACDKETNRCPILYSPNSTFEQDRNKGGAAFIMAIVILFVAMTGIVYIFQFLLFGMPTKVVHTCTSCNGYIGMLFGMGITFFVQSSTTVTCMLIPVAGVGAMQLRQVYPVVLGANLGTATQVLVTALGSTVGKAPLQVALAHLFFNLIGVIIWYPIPPLRNIPIWAAKRLGRGAEIWRFFPVFWIVLMWCIMELFFIGLSTLFTKDTRSATACGSIIVILTTGLLGGLWYWCKYKGGDDRYANFMLRLTLTRPRKSTIPINLLMRRHTDSISTNNSSADDGATRDDSGPTSQAIPCNVMDDEAELGERVEL